MRLPRPRRAFWPVRAFRLGALLGETGSAPRSGRSATSPAM